MSYFALLDSDSDNEQIPKVSVKKEKPKKEAPAVAAVPAKSAPQEVVAIKKNEKTDDKAAKRLPKGIQSSQPLL